MIGRNSRRDAIDLILEALDIAASRKLAWADTQALALEIMAIERPDLSADRVKKLMERIVARQQGGPYPSPSPG
ncbi:MAG TPA: hypothetical protein VF342_15795 [Alphaproteobacteria bacterium]